MIPVRMQLTGFLSYLDTVDISFDDFDLACISGQNGAGKSSILDGITWALFDKARGSGDEIINSRADAAEVILDFDYEGSLYRVQRSKARGKTTLLEFFIRDEGERWRPLTESSIRATEAKIQKILRMDYETFINASFFLQGKADQFSQQSPGDRKRILANVLGLEIWETYRLQAAKTIRAHEQERAILTGQLQSYDDELARETQYKERLSQLQKDLVNLDELLKSKTGALDAALQQENLLQSLRKSLDEKTARLRTEQQRLDEQHKRYTERTAERDTYQKILEHASEIEKQYQSWLKDRQQLEHWESLKSSLRKVEEKRAAQQGIIDQKRAGLQAQRDALRQRQSEKETLENDAPTVEQNLAGLQSEAAALMEQKQNQSVLMEKVQVLRLEVVEFETNQQTHTRELNSLTERIDRLGEAEEEACPVCKKPLSASERQRMVTELQTDKTALETHVGEMTGQLQLKRSQIKSITEQLTAMQNVDVRLQQVQQMITREETRLSHIRETVADFEKKFKPQLAMLENSLQTEDFEPAARAELTRLAAEAGAIGYDALEHEKVSQAELSGRSSEDAMRQVDKARAALSPLEREIATIETSIAKEEKSLTSLMEEKQAAEKEYEEMAARIPNKSILEREVYTLKEQTNIKRSEVGAAENNLNNLKNIRERQKTLLAQRDEILRQISRLKDLERAFSKDGVPALLIEQALPEIEIQANDLLERLSNETMSLKFETQADYKSGKRTDKKETLEIKISDSSGEYREYEMYSGGEAFRVNFAIRLALSRVLAHRAGARLQTLVIDEGFGSQDADGRQRLIEAINQVRRDFEKILVITHLEELKDAFPARIEVEKGTNGSSVRVQVL
ncbi:MAG: AAA family ATPase [Bellilinea sp.]